MDWLVDSAPRRTPSSGGVLPLLGLALAVVLIGCTGGPRPLGTVLPEEIVDPGAVVIEYLGSDAGEPIPAWLSVPVPDLELNPEFAETYVFRFMVEAESLQETQATLALFPESRSVAGAIIARALAKASAVDGVSENLIDRAVRIVAAAEYAGTARVGEFWVHEEVSVPITPVGGATDAESESVPDVVTVTRYRGWLVYSVPRDQVLAGLRLAWENASAAFPPATDPDLRAREALQVRFIDGL